MSIRSVIVKTIEEVATEHSKQLPPVTDDLSLLDSGLDSLCFAVLIARLDAELDLDPFTATSDIVFPQTVGEMIELYEGAALERTA